MKIRRVTATEDDDGQRADVVVGRHLPDVSRRAARALGLRGGLYIDGRRQPPSANVASGSVLELRWPDAGPPPPLRLLALTPQMLYVDKPSGVHTHRLRPDDPPALADAVVARFRECEAASADPREGGAVHRLDAATSGVVAFARARTWWDRARAGFAARTVQKVYVALCVADRGAPWPPPPDVAGPVGGPPPRGAPPTLGRGIRIELRLGEGSDRRIEARPDGRPARTDAWCVGLRRGPASTRALLLLSLVTGQRHQARAHLAAIGWPIAGDPLHPGVTTDPAAARLMLHAARIDLGAAVPGQRPIVAPWPAPLAAAWAHWGRRPPPGLIRPPSG